MKHLPLYPDRRQPLDTSQSLDQDAKCQRCPRRQDARTVCMPADVRSDHDASKPLTGGILVVGSSPTKTEDNAARPFSSNANRRLRVIIEELYEGPVVYKNALGCWKQGKNKKAAKTLQKEVDACRPFLKSVADEAKPERILCFGKDAFWSVTGSETPPQHARRGYSHLEDGTPVFLLPAAASQFAIRFLAKRFREDIEWALTADPEPAPYDMLVEVIETPEEAEQAAQVLRQGKFWSYDTETAGIIGSDYFDVICLAAVPYAADRVFVWGEAALKDDATVEPLRALLKDKSAPMVGHNLKYDLKAASHGIAGMLDYRGGLLARGVFGDTLLWTKMLDTEVLGRLEYQADRVGMGGHKQENAAAVERAVTWIREERARPNQPMLPGLLDKPMEAALRYPNAAEKAFAYGLVNRDILYRYCALDTVATARLALLMQSQIYSPQHPNNALVNDTFIRPSTGALAQLESWGMSADADAARLAGVRLKQERDEAEKQIRALGCEINIGSNEQLSQYLFTELKLPVLGYTDTGAPSVKADYLKPLKDEHPIIEPLLAYAKTDKLISTYADGLVPHIIDGRIHTSINQDGTRAGRWSSSNPNLQNIPSGGVYAKMIKNIFNAPPGYVVIQLDYSQLELRIAAMLTGDPKMIQIYKDGLDFHQRTAELIAEPMWGIDPSQVTKDHRRSAKTFNFGVWYGQGDGTIANNLGVSRQVAKQLRFEVLGQFEKAGPWIDERKRFTMKHGVTYTYWDGQVARVRQLPNIASSDDYLVSKASNGSFNTAVQGTAAQYMERTIGAVIDWILSEHIPARVTNTVHDSIIIECPADWAEEVITVVKGIMEGWPSGEVPLIADAEVGPSWGALMDFDLLRKTMHTTRSGFLTDQEICRVLGFEDKDGKPDLDMYRTHLALAERLRL